MTPPSLKSPPPAPAKRLPGRPRDDRLRARREEQILCKATAVFAEHGYPNTDVQFIADPLRISKGTIYRYFPSKERLFLAAVERGVRQLDEVMVAEIQGPGEPLDRFAAAIRAYLRFFQENPALVELFIQERAEFREQRKPVYFEHGCSAECPFKELIDGLMAEGRLRAMPVERIMNVMGDLVYGTMFTNYLIGRTKSFEEQARDVIDVAFNGILSDAERRRRGAASAAGNGRNGNGSHDGDGRRAVASRR